MLILRALGLLFLAVGFVSLVVDGVRTIASANLVITPLGQAWFDLHPGSLNLTQAVIERYTFPFLWDPVFVSVLLMPGWVVFTVIGALIYYLGRRRAPSGILIN
jgi:hypothetical protein